MDFFLELVKKRYSVRNYQNKSVEETKLSYILECGRLAPSAVNFQPYHIIVARDPEMLHKITATYGRQWIKEAPIVLVICGDHSKSWKRADGKDFSDIDAAIMIDHLSLAATEQGLGTCWVCNFDVQACHSALKLPETLEPIALLPLGYPAPSTDDNPRHLKRKKIEDIVTFDSI